MLGYYSTSKEIVFFQLLVFGYCQDVYGIRLQYLIDVYF